MLSDSEYEELYVQFFELDTDELLSVTKYNMLSNDEHAVLYKVMMDRRDEIDAMIAMLNSDLANLGDGSVLSIRAAKLKKNGLKFKIPEDILLKILSSSNLTEWKSMLD